MNTQQNRFDIKAIGNDALERYHKAIELLNKNSQFFLNWIIFTTLAELTFLGTVLLRNSTSSVWLVKTLTIVLLVSLILFFVGMIFRNIDTRNTVKMFENAVKKSSELLISGQNTVASLPQELQLPTEMIEPGETSQNLVGYSFLLVIVATAGIIFLVIKL